MNDGVQVESVACNLCGTDRAHTLFVTTDRLTANDTRFGVVRCLECGLVYVSPRPTSDCLGHFYPSHFVSYQFETFDGPAATLRERTLTMITRSSADAQAKVVATLLHSRRPTCVLDVGCGKGRFLQAMRAQGCEVSGIDFDEPSVAHCRDALGLNVIRGGPADLDRLDRTYDLITMWQFLEHALDPLATLQASNRRLRKDGLLVVQVPNVDSLENRVFGEYSYLYDVPRHTYHFSRDTITRLLERTGFRVERIATPVLAGGWIGSLQTRLTGGAIFADLKGHIFMFLAISLALAPLEYVLSLTRVGSLMTVTARKTSDA